MDRAVRKTVEVPFQLMEGYAVATLADPEGMRYATDNIYTNAAPEVVGERIQELFRTLPTPKSHVYWLNLGTRLAVARYGAFSTGPYLRRRVRRVG